MTDVLVKPAFQSLVADSGDATKLGPNAWNAARLFSAGALGDLVYRDPGSATGASYLTPGPAGSLFVSAGPGSPAGWSLTPTVTSLTLTVGPVTLSRLNNNATQILVQSTVPPEGRAHEAPFLWYQGGALFTGAGALAGVTEYDPVLYIGYNADRAITTEPAMRGLVVEGNYVTTSRNVEAYMEYFDPVSVGSGSVRPFFFFKNDKTTTVANAAMTFTINAEQLIQAGNRAAPITFQMSPINQNQPANINVVGSGTGSASNQYLVLAGGNTESNAAYLRLFGNTCTSGAGNKGVVQIVGGVVSSPTVSTQGIVVLATGASSTERVRVQYDGLVGIGLPGTTLTSLLQLGAGTTAVAPLKFTSSGVNVLATPQNGAQEYDGTNLFFTRTGAVRETVLCASAVTVETAAQTRTVTTNIAGVTVKLLAA